MPYYFIFLIKEGYLLRNYLLISLKFVPFMRHYLPLLALCCSFPSMSYSQESYRPAFHFTPQKGWMNDPNGLVFYNNTYHLFYQYYPDKTVWGPMHWGHATSTDLVHWMHKPIALYPDSLGYIFSGSAIIDKNNTAGFGKNALVAIYTNHNISLEQEKSNKFQYQSLAFSLNNGKTWKKYPGNPVLPNPGIRDFRDPNVSWNEQTKKWIMSLATQDCISFYSSDNLKNWKKESEFGKEIGAHGGVWECPDLMSFEVDGEKIWVLLVSINPGGPNKGSATQYFVGKFDGNKFKPFNTKTKWIDWGKDDYAGVTWHNIGKKNIFIGWMSNWFYGEKVPTKEWRSAMTIPRNLGIKKINTDYFLTSTPISAYFEKRNLIYESSKLTINKSIDLSDKISTTDGLYSLSIKQFSKVDFKIVLSNKDNNKIVFGYNKSSDSFYMDRSQSGIVNFSEDFKKIITAPRISNNKMIDIKIVLDKTSLEIFADDGLTTMTSIFFPESNMSKINIETNTPTTIGSLSLYDLKSLNSK